MSPARSSLAERMHGAFTALATPFRAGRVDRAALARFVAGQIRGGVAGLVPCGTTGESSTLSDEEQRRVVETVVEAANGRVPVVAGAGSNDTRHAVALAKAARRAGADGVLAVSPYYVRPTQEGLYRHFRALVEEGGLPVVLYHIPSRTAVSIEVETIARLWGAGGIVALKESGGVDRVTRIREACPVPILSGDDGATLPMMALGAKGVVSVASNVAPEAVALLVAHAESGRFREALQSHERLSPLVRALFLESSPIPVKAALALLGWFSSDEVRLPLVPASPATRAALKAALASVRPARAR